MSDPAHDEGAWRRSRQKLEQMILAQLLIDRDAGRKVVLEVGGEPVPSGGLSRDELWEAAQSRASEHCRRAIAKRENPRAVLRRKREAGEAA